MDADGSITVRPSRLDEVLEKAEARATKEEEDRQRFQNDQRSFDRPGWRAIVETSR